MTELSPLCAKCFPWGSGLTVSTQMQIKCCRNFYCVIHCLRKKIFHAKSKDLLTDSAPLKGPLKRAQPGSQDLAISRGPHRKLSNWSPLRPWQWRAFCEDPCRWWSLGGGGGGRVSGGRSENSLLGGSKKNSLPVGGGWGEREVKTLLLKKKIKEKKAKKITAGGRGGEGKEKWKLYSEREQRKSLPVGGGWGEREVKTLLLKKKIKEKKAKKITAGGRGGGGGVRGRRSETLLLRGSKENHCRWEGGEGKEKWKLYYWEGATKEHIHCRLKGVSGRRSEDFITGREHKKKMNADGRGVSGEKGDFITGREHKKSLPVRVGVGAWGKVWRFCHRQVAPKQKYKVGKQSWEAQGNEVRVERPTHTHKYKIRTSKQSKHKVLSSRHKVKFVSQPLPVKKKKSVTHRQKPNAPSTASKYGSKP